MRFELVGWPADGPKLALDYRAFSYAGKFVMSNTGKAVALADANEGSPAGADAAGATGGDASERPPPATDVEGVVDPDGRVLGAVAFNADRTDPGTLWLRYVTVRHDRRGEGVGPQLCAFVVDRAADRGYDRVRIAVNNPFAYEALYRAGFGFTGETTGLAELVLERPADEPAARPSGEYQEGLDRFRERELSDEERSFLQRKVDEPAPPTE